MNAADISNILSAQRTYFADGATLDVDFRIRMLKKLKAAILAHEADIAQALEADLGKAAFESYMCETGMVLSELSYMIAHTPKFAAKRVVHTPLAQFAAKSYKHPSPYGNVLIMSPWNYPFLLTMDPLVNAISAGNTAVVKPSAYSPAVSALVERILSECFQPEYVAVVTGGRAENAALLDQDFDLIFFTGSQSVGKEVLRRAAEHLTPAVLELGGKSPCIVDETANLPLAARRIVFGKFINCGQTCVAPDYVLCHEAVKDDLAALVKKEICRQYGQTPLADPSYGKIINEKHFFRLCRLMDPAKTVHGGQVDPARCQIAPTVLDGVTWDDPVMQEEIFGPILPILTYRDFEEIYELTARRPDPLALYLFSENKERIRSVTARCSFGGGCINDTIIHLATSEMGFGGVGGSGMGSYHGKEGFDAFSHAKSIVDKKTWMDLPMRYRPYQPLHEKLVRLFLR